MSGVFGGHVALVTGASSGIGAALALEFARRGAGVALLARRVERMEAIAKEIRALGREAAVIRCDVRSDQDVVAAVAETLAVFGRLDIIVANAGFGVVGPVRRLSIEDYRRQFDTNVFGVLRTIQAALPALERTRGRLVIMGSVAGHISAPGSSAYSMSKFALRALAQSLEHELAPVGVSVTLVSPGYVDSEIWQIDNEGVRHPDARPTTPRWLRMRTARAARQIAHAIARRRREAVITGHGKALVLAQRFAPGLLARVIRHIRRRVHRPDRDARRIPADQP